MLLGKRPFLLGEAAVTVDALAFGFLANLLWAPMEPSLQQAAQQLGNLEPYCQRLRERLFPEPRE